MKDKGVPRTGDKLVRKPARQRGNTDIRPFKAPRLVNKDTDSNTHTEVQAITEKESDTSGKTTELIKSPELIKDSVPGSIEEVVLKTKAPRKVKGWVYITEIDGVEIPVPKLVAKETEQQDSSGESDDNVPVATLLQYKTATSLTTEQMQDIKGKDATERQDDSDVETSDGEGSEYDRHDYEREVKQTKRKRKEVPKKAKKTKKKNWLASYCLNPETKPLLAKRLQNLTKHKKKL